MTCRVYVTNPDSGSVSIIDASSNTLIDDIGVGGTPTGIAVSPPDDGGEYDVFVTDPSQGRLWIIDPSDYSKTSIAVGKKPFGVAVSSPDDG